MRRDFVAELRRAPGPMRPMLVGTEQYLHHVVTRAAPRLVHDVLFKSPSLGVVRVVVVLHWWAWLSFFVLHFYAHHVVRRALMHHGVAGIRYDVFVD